MDDKKVIPFSLDLIKRGDCIVYANDGSKYGHIIEKRQLVAGFVPDHAKYTHVEISGGGEYSVNITLPKSKLIDITKVHVGRNIRVMRFKGENWEEKRHAVAYFSATLCNKPYDIRGVSSFIFSWIRHNPDWPFCSEGGAWSIQMEYPKAFNHADPSKIMPAHFCLPKWFDLIWEGQIPKEVL